MSDDTFRQRLQATGQHLDQLRPRIDARGPWPLAARFDHDPEAAWGPMELLAHVAEMLPYWLGEVERILSGPPEPVPFGRVGTDPIRIGLIGRDRALPTAELYVRIDSWLERWSHRLASLTPAQRAKLGLHPRLGQMTVEAIVERMIVHHLDEHVDQLESILGNQPQPG
ncbi:MAG: DinB family protein [Candidatus Limnocylindrales bacterium]